jgi:hypothetical protein
MRQHLHVEASQRTAPDDGRDAGVLPRQVTDRDTGGRRRAQVSNTATMPWIVGSPCRAGLPGKFALTLATKIFA